MVAILTNRIYLPAKIVPSRVLQDYYTYIITHDRCKYCTDNDLCSACAYRPVEVRSYLQLGNAVALPAGNLRKAREFLKELGIRKVEKFQAQPPMPAPITFSRELYSYQKPAVESWLKERHGILLSPPRSGKTIMAVYISCVLNTRTLVLAHREDLLYQFEEEYRKATDLSQVERWKGRKLITFTRNLKKCPEQIINYNIVLSTFQFFFKQPSLLRLWRRVFGLIVVDECHHIPAPCFNRVADVFHAKYKLGLSATPERKDKMHYLLFDVLGPITAEASPPTLKPTVEVVLTNVKVGTFYRWTTFVNRLSRNTKRNKLIAEYIERDYKNGRSILVVVGRVNQLSELAKLLQAKKIPFKEFYGSIPAVRRKQVLELARKRDVRVVVATRQVVQEGVNCPAWDTLYFIVPSANPSGIYQEVSRICTPDPHKKKPLIRYFLDEEKAAFACWQKAKRVFAEKGFTIHIPPPKEQQKNESGLRNWYRLETVA